MDNLAHSAMSVTLAGIISPELVQRYKFRFIATSVAIVNLPDIDILGLFFGKEFYQFQHRGLTHSLTGLMLMIPMCLWIYSWFRKQLPVTDKDIYGIKYGLTHVILPQLCIGHFLLDYLTTYGTMFLYPWSTSRFSFPLMFIIDPIFWAITCCGALLILRSSHPARIKKISLATLSSCVCLWLILTGFKWTAEINFKTAQPGITQIQSFPGPGAPAYWLLLGMIPQRDSNANTNTNEIRESFQYIQASQSFLKPQINVYLIPDEYQHQQLCQDLAFSPQATDSFEQYRDWGEYIICKPWESHGLPGCQCYSLKYGIASKGLIAYGGFFIPSHNKGWFNLPNRNLDAFLNYYQNELF